MIKIFGLNSLSYLWGKLKEKLAAKYDKSGGDISGDVKVFGNLTLDIDDEDYDAGIRFTKTLDNNAGTILTLNGYAGGTNYKPVIRNVANPVSDYDVANKRYVDSKIVTPDSYLVFLNEDGSIDTYSSSLTYAKVKAELTSYTTEVYLDVVYSYTEDGTQKNARIHVPALQDMDTNSGPIVFAGSIRMHTGSVTEAIFLLDSNNSLTVYYTTRENALLKTSDLSTYATSQLHYPTVYGVWNTFQRKPVTVWETDGTTGLIALQTDDSASVAWQLTGLDLTPYKRVKIHAKSAGSGNGVLPALVMEILLDARGANANSGNYIGSVLFQNPNNNNRLGTLSCSISADKTKFAVLRMNSIYGTAATSNSGTNAYVYMIEGYYD